MDKATLKYYIETLIDHYKDRDAIIYRKRYRTETWTYLDLYNLAHKVAVHFKKKNIKKGDRILIYGNNSPEWVSVFMGCAISGVVAVPIDFNSSSDFAAKIAKKVKVKIIFCSYRKPVPGGIEQIFLEDLKHILKDTKSQKINTEISADTLLQIVYTSGTTTKPKGVMITNKNLVSNIHSLRLVMPARKNYVFLSTLPLSHLFEQVLGLMNPLRYGAKIIYLESRRSKDIAKALSQEKVTHIVTVPLFLEVFEEKIETKIGNKREFEKLAKATYFLPNALKKIIFYRIHQKLGGHLKSFIVGGAYLDVEVEDFWNSVGIRVLQGYGLTEASPVVSCNTKKNRKQHSVGKILPNVDLKIAKDEEILISGPNVTQGYYNNKKATNNRIKDGWFHTGDLGYIDKQGFLHIKGRKKDMIKSSSGVNVYPEDIEAVINKFPKVKNSCVVGINEDGKTNIKAAVIFTGKPDLESIREKANNKLSIDQQISEIVAWKGDDFPRTSTLKVKKRLVREKLSKNISENIIYKKEDKITSIISKFTSTEEIKESSLLVADLKIDSVHRVELLAQLEEEFNIEISEDLIDQNTTVKDLKIIIKNSNKKQNKQIISKWPLRVGQLRIILQYFVFLISKLFIDLEIKGRNNLKVGDYPVIFVANHSSHLDTLVILNSIPSRIRKKTAVAAAEDYFFNRILLSKIVMLFFNAYPFSRTSQIRKSMEYSGWLLDQNFSLIVYPEGGRSKNGKLQNFKAGIGMLAKELEVDVIPIGIVGTNKILPKGKLTPSKGKVTVKIGKRLEFNHDKSYVELTNKIEEAVKRLI